MKNILLVLLIGFALSLCNLSERFKKGSSTSGPSASGGSSSLLRTCPSQPQRKRQRSPAARKRSGTGRECRGPFHRIGPKRKNESKSFMMRSPGGGDAASLIVSISPMDESFPDRRCAFRLRYEQAKDRAKNGEVDEVKWVEIDGLKGVQFREANPEKPDGHRRLQWLAYRKYTGQVQGINVMLATQGKDFERHKDAMYGILYSMKVSH